MSDGNPGYFKQVKTKFHLFNNENKWTDAADFLIKFAIGLMQANHIIEQVCVFKI